VAQARSSESDHEQLHVVSVVLHGSAHLDLHQSKGTILKLTNKHLTGIRKLAALCMAAAILTACGGGGGGDSAGSNTTTVTGTPGNLTLTGNASGSSVSGLYNISLANLTSTIAGDTVHIRTFINSANTHVASMRFSDLSTGGSVLQFNVTPDSQAATPEFSILGSTAGFYSCVVTAVTATSAYSTSPTCTSIGVAISRTAGTVSFTNSPSVSSVTSTTGTITGSLTFTPF
jgi:hypothetical protein